MAELVPLMVTAAERDILRDVLLAVTRAKGGGSVTVKYVPGAGLAISGVGGAGARSGGREQFALVELTDAGTGGDGWYTAQEVVPDDETADPPTWAAKDPGRTFGEEEGDEGEVLDPLLRAGLDAPSSGAAAVFWARRVPRALGDGGPFWSLVGGGDSLPTGSGQYKVLQLDADDEKWFDWVRAH